MGISQRTLCHANAPMGEVCVCQCDSYSDIRHTSKAACSLRGLLQTQPRAVCACSGHVCLSACIFHSASDLSPIGPEENDSTHQTAHPHLNVHRFNPSNFPHGSGIQIHTGDPTQSTRGHHIHVTASHSAKEASCQNK